MTTLDRFYRLAGTMRSLNCSPQQINNFLRAGYIPQAHTLSSRLLAKVRRALPPRPPSSLHRTRNRVLPRKTISLQWPQSIVDAADCNLTPTEKRS